MTPARGEIGRVRTPLRLSTAGSCGHAKSRATAAAPPGGRGEFPGNPPRLSRGLLGERKARSHGNASMPRSAPARRKRITWTATTATTWARAPTTDDPRRYRDDRHSAGRDVHRPHDDQLNHEHQPPKPRESRANNGPTHRLDHPGARQAHLGARRFAPRPLCACSELACQSIRSAAELRALLESLEGGTAKDDD